MSRVASRSALGPAGDPPEPPFDGARVTRLLMAAGGGDSRAFDEALHRFPVPDPRAALVVECRVSGGPPAAETAEVLAVSVPTVPRDGRSALAWVRNQLVDGPGAASNA